MFSFSSETFEPGASREEKEESLYVDSSSISGPIVAEASFLCINE